MPEKTVQQFVDEHQIKMMAKPVSKNPYVNDMPEGSRHWRCVFTMGRRQMSVFFSQGPALKDDPTAACVLGCIASDASSVDQASTFESWCGDYGYDTDSRRAERTYDVCKQQAAALRRLLGDKALYDELLYDTDH